MKNFEKNINGWLLLIIILCILTSILVPLFMMFFGAYVLTPNPPPPHIISHEFPFRLEYEFDGNVSIVHDILICEFDGYDFSTATGEKYRKWKCYLKSGNNRITLGKKEGLEFYCFPLSDPFDPVAGRYMGDPFYNGRAYDSPPTIFYTDNFEDKTIDGILNEVEAWEKYKIRILHWEIVPPIENKFSTTE